MSIIMNTYLRLSWSVSRGRDTYGYNILTLTDEGTGKRYRCNGGGYDMVGTVFGMWLQDTHQEELTRLAYRHAHLPGGAYRSEVKGFYGLFVNKDSTLTVDGGCGIGSMLKIAEALGIGYRRTYKHTGRNRGETTGWIVTRED